MKKFKKLTSLILALLMVCTSFAWNGLEVQAETEYETVEVAEGDGDAFTLTSQDGEVTKDDTKVVDGGSYFRLNDGGYIKVALKPEYTSIKIEFVHSNAQIGIGFGGATNYAWTGIGTAAKTITVVIEKTSEDSWTSKYSIVSSKEEDCVAETIYGTIDTTTSDGYIYFGRNATSGVCRLYSFDVTATQPAVYAKIGDSVYSSLDAALEGAVDTDTIVLQKAVTVADTYITKDITIDLNGNTLTANSLVTFDADIVDSSEAKSGLLVCNKLMVPNNSQMPVYDSTAGGYRLAEVTYDITNLTDDAVVGKYVYSKLWAEFENNETVYNALYAGQESSKVRMGVRLTWNGGDNVQDCYFNDTIVAGIYNFATPGAAQFKLIGLDNYSDIAATPIVISATGVTNISDTALTVNATTE